MIATTELRRQAKADAQAAIEAAGAELHRGAIDEVTWSTRVTDALAVAYLLEDDPRWQSGFDGDPALWRQARELVLDAIDRDGTLLDVGCATGHLIECLATWAEERGLKLLLSGLDLSSALVQTARRRLPAWADRICEGNAITWDPPSKFTYVRTSLEYVPPDRQSFLITRLLRDVVEARGRLIVGPVSPPELEVTKAAFASAGINEPGVVARTDRDGKARYALWVANIASVR